MRRAARILRERRKSIGPDPGEFMDCVFCKIVSGEIPSSRVFEDGTTVAFMDQGQVNPGHVIVATRSHVESILGLDDGLARDVFATAARVAKALQAAFHPQGITLLQANGAAGWQTVFHFHLHVLPRHADDGVNITWPAKRPPAAELARLAEKVKSGFA